jgi:catechol 2,3-dioxygenase-like lactoylglutathione lyase family enzyme
MGFKGILYLFQYVSDLERSAGFYGDKLGFEPGKVEAHIRGYRFGDGHLAIHVDDRPAGERVYQGGAYAAAQVEDVDAYHAELRKRGVEAGEVRDWPWGERSFCVSDPDGYVWTFAGVG